MQAKLLQYKALQGGKSWYLASYNLYDYLRSITPNTFEYNIQRRIVKNSFLDKLWENVIAGDPFPAITLTAQRVQEQEGVLSIECYDILDGLQRTFRLWSIVYLNDIIEQYNYHDVKEIVAFMKEDEMGNRILESGIMNRTIIKSLLDSQSEVQLHEIIKAYRAFDIILYIWSGLNDNEIIKKMLILNAGQRSVSSTHQFELMFLHYFDRLSLPTDVKIFRERDPEFFQVKNKGRKCGQYLMSSVIISMQSFIDKSPVRIQPANALRIDDSIVEMSAADYFSTDNLSAFIRILHNFDKRLNNHEISQWLMKDTTLSGLFAAIGKYLEKEENSVEGKLQHMNDSLNQINQVNIRYEDFKNSYESLSSTSVNIGNVLRKGIFNYFLAVLKGEKADWEKAINKKNDE